MRILLVLSVFAVLPLAMTAHAQVVTLRCGDLQNEENRGANYTLDVDIPNQRVVLANGTSIRAEISERFITFQAPGGFLSRIDRTTGLIYYFANNAWNNFGNQCKRVKGDLLGD